MKKSNLSKAINNVLNKCLESENVYTEYIENVDTINVSAQWEIKPVLKWKDDELVETGKKYKIVIITLRQGYKFAPDDYDDSFKNEENVIEYEELSTKKLIK